MMPATSRNYTVHTSYRKLLCEATNGLEGENMQTLHIVDVDCGIIDFPGFFRDVYDHGLSGQSLNGNLV